MKHNLEDQPPPLPPSKGCGNFSKKTTKDIKKESAKVKPAIPKRMVPEDAPDCFSDPNVYSGSRQECVVCPFEIPCLHWIEMDKPNAEKIKV